tara:strand:+ start:560 stop:3811 length:3252 start_codon:yes stop_codon:yes gene_type:complete
MSTDSTFFTNEEGKTLLDRFKQTISKAKYFDALVGYFRMTGFHNLYEELQSVDKIRILVGLEVDSKSYDLIEETRQEGLDFESNKKVTEITTNAVIDELNNAEDSYNTEISGLKFKEFLTTDCKDSEEDKAKGGNGKKLEFRVYPSKNIHAKVYITQYKDEIADIQKGSVITGSSNFSVSGLKDNREFNVELKNDSDIKFALKQFEDLWKQSVDISRDYIATLDKKTWLNDNISPYELYLKMLYEYFKEDINIDQQTTIDLPEGFMDLEYQKQAVASAKKILDGYNGVFLADVVGLGKTFISALLAQQLQGGKLIICPPVLKEYWEETLFEFGVKKYYVESMGKLDKIVDELKVYPTKYSTIFIDEAHRFRNEYTQSYEKLFIATRNKKVVLVSATPLNNRFGDILSQIKLFQSPKKSWIPGIPNLQDFFDRLEKPLKKLKRSDEEYAESVRTGSELIRDRVLKHIMVRRTRTEIKNYFFDDIKQQGLFFPEVENPHKIVYAFDDSLSHIFTSTLEILKQFTYSRYTPKRFIKKSKMTLYKIQDFELQQQKNLGGFMKGILIKRLESSFFAFKQSVDRFINSYEKFIQMYESGTVLISKKINVYDILDRDDLDELIEKFGDDMQKYESSDFEPNFPELLKKDLEFLNDIKVLWKYVNDDPKLETFIDTLKSDKYLKDNKVVIFTESKETGDYLFDNLNKNFPDKVLFFSSHGGMIGDERKSNAEARYVIKENFDPNFRAKKDDLNILITTDILAEGINLHRSNIIINYDLPWNPTRVLQRVGRVNRVGTKHKSIYIYNFFPTDESEAEINLEANIKNKIQAFHDTLGEDSRYLTEDEIVSTHELFGSDLYKKLNSKETYDTESKEDSKSEFYYLKILRDLRDNDSEMFERIKRLPKKSRSAIESKGNNKLITFFRKGKLKKFILSSKDNKAELNFLDAVEIFNSTDDKRKISINKDYYDLLKINKEVFDEITTEELAPQAPRGGRSNESTVIAKLKGFKKSKEYTDEEEEYISIILEKYRLGEIPLKTTQNIKKALDYEANPLKVIKILKDIIPDELLMDKRQTYKSGLIKNEVILSEYIKGN